jgi:hypothetical protein
LCGFAARRNRRPQSTMLNLRIGHTGIRKRQIRPSGDIVSVVRQAIERG